MCTKLVLFIKDHTRMHDQQNIKFCNQYFTKLHKYFKCYCVTWPAIDYKLPEDDTIVPKHVGLQ